MTASVTPLLATFSPMDMGIIFLVILIFFGAKKLPEFARSMGQAVREFSKAKDDFEREITRPAEPVQTPQIEAPKDEAIPTHDEQHPADVQIVETHPVEGTQPQEPAQKI